MSLIQEIKAAFGTENLYDVLKLEKSSFNESKLKKAYYKLALEYHPDKNTENSKQEATLKFQLLGKIHKILACKEKREWYNASGEIIEEDIDDNFGKSDDAEAWEDYWRTLYPKVTVSKLKEFEQKYKRSEEEREDVLKAYTECKGDMDKIMDSVILARLDDEDRFRKIIEKEVEEGELKSFRAFTGESEKKKEAREKRYRKEEEEAEEHAKFLAQEKVNETGKNSEKSDGKNSRKGTKKGKNDDFDLVAVMEARMAKRRVQGEAFLNDLEKKYCQPKKSKKNKQLNEDLDKKLKKNDLK